MKKITCKIAGDYLGISSMAVSIGMRNNLLPIGFAIHNVIVFLRRLMNILEQKKYLQFQEKKKLQNVMLEQELPC